MVMLKEKMGGGEAVRPMAKEKEVAPALQRSSFSVILRIW